MKGELTYKTDGCYATFGASVCYISLLGLKYHIVSPIKLSLVKSQSYKLLGKGQGIFHAAACGDITIGDNSVIGGNVWLTESLPEGTKITATPPENRRKTVI